MNPRIVIITTSALTTRCFLEGQIRLMASEGFDIHTICSPGPQLEECRRNLGVPMHETAMMRRISPLADAVALLRLALNLRRLRPAIVHTHTPKAGLLGMGAARLAGVPVRIYTINGLRFATCAGLRRALLKTADKLGCWLATDILCVSNTLREEAIALGLCPPHKVKTLGDGGSHGVDTSRFDPDRRNSADRQSIRLRYGLPSDALVIGYIGRIVRDKGIAELFSAWRVLRDEFPNLRLFLCGAPEEEDPLPRGLIQALRDDPRVRLAGEMLHDMPAFYAAIDISVLPSHREGLPNAALESQAMRVPLVATRIVGTTDAVRDGTTGFLVEPRNSAALAQALRPLILDGELRARIGAAGRVFVSRHFQEERISALLAAEYRRLRACHSSPDVPKSSGAEPRKVSNGLKTVIEALVAACGLAVASPLLLLIGFFTRLSTGSTALFRQTRIGLNSRPFTLYKFRTMREARDSNGNGLPDEERLTHLGGFLRRTSLDELPELFNVILGEMSFVGPRPLLPQYLPRYNSFQRRRHELKPGITGWAQVKGRNALTWEEKFELDVWYVDHASPWLDLKILWLTCLAVLGRRGIQHAGHTTMPEFLGSHEGTVKT